MSYYSEYQKIDLNPNNEMRLDDAFDIWKRSGKPAVDSSEFDSLCDDYSIEPWELQDIVDDFTGESK